MKAAQLELDRVSITLHGISAELAEAAAQGLEDALRRRLQSMRAPLGSATLGESPGLLSVSASIEQGASPAELRALLVEQIASALASSAGEVSQ